MVRNWYSNVLAWIVMKKVMMMRLGLRFQQGQQMRPLKLAKQLFQLLTQPELRFTRTIDVVFIIGMYVYPIVLPCNMTIHDSLAGLKTLRNLGVRRGTREYNPLLPQVNKGICAAMHIFEWLLLLSNSIGYKTLDQMARKQRANAKMLHLIVSSPASCRSVSRPGSTAELQSVTRRVSYFLTRLVYLPSFIDTKSILNVYYRWQQCSSSEFIPVPSILMCSLYVTTFRSTTYYDP